MATPILNVGFSAGAGGASVDYNVIGGTAIQDSDFTVGGSGTLNFPSGSTSQSFTVTIIDDNNIENLDEYVDDPNNNDDELIWSCSNSSILQITIEDRVAKIDLINSKWFGSEVITYTGISADDLTGCTRGVLGLSLIHI